MEEEAMAMSLLLAVLGVNDREDLSKQSTGYDIDPDDRAHARKYLNDLDDKKKREVRKALYEALYAIVEGGEVNRDINMAIALALCQAMTGNHAEDLRHHEGTQRLRKVLNPIVKHAIDDALA
jgi:hypothetical protein